MGSRKPIQVAGWTVDGVSVAGQVRCTHVFACTVLDERSWSAAAQVHGCGTPVPTITCRCAGAGDMHNTPPAEYRLRYWTVSESISAAAACLCDPRSHGSHWWHTVPCGDKVLPKEPLTTVLLSSDHVRMPHLYRHTIGQALHESKPKCHAGDLHHTRHSLTSHKPFRALMGMPPTKLYSLPEICDAAQALLAIHDSLQHEATPFEVFPLSVRPP